MKRIMKLSVLFSMLLGFCVILSSCGGDEECYEPPIVPPVVPPPVVPPPVVPPVPAPVIVRAQLQYWQGNVPGETVLLPLINNQSPPPPAIIILPGAQFRILAQTVTRIDGVERVDPVDPINIPRLQLGGYPGAMDQWYDPHAGWFYHLDSTLPQVFCATGDVAGCPISFSYVVGAPPL